MPVPSLSLDDFIVLGKIAYLAEMKHFHSINSCLQDPKFQQLPLQWRAYESADGHGRALYAVTPARQATNAGRMYVMMENGASAPVHIHHKGEVIVVLAGALVDTADDGTEILLGPGESTVHGWQTVHAPRLNQATERTPSFVLLWCDQPGNPTCGRWNEVDGRLAFVPGVP